MSASVSQTLSPQAVPTVGEQAVAASGQSQNIFVRHLVEGISGLPDITNGEISALVKLPGRTVDKDGHQIAFQVDVVWAFDSQGQHYRAIVHCRNWAQPVTLQSVLAMKSLLSELSDEATAVIVTMRGIEKVALEHARASGIKICLLRPLTQEQLNNSDFEAFVRFKGSVPALSDIQLQIDPNCVETLSAEEQADLAGADGRCVTLYSEGGTKLGTLADLCSALIPKSLTKDGGERRVERPFKDAVYIHVVPSNKRVRLSGVSAAIRVESFESGLDRREIAGQLKAAIVS